MNWLMTILALVLLLIVRGRSKPKWLWVVAAALALIAGTGLVTTRVADVAVGAGDWVAGVFGASGSVVMGVAMLILTVVVAFDVVTDRSLDTTGTLALLLLPILFAVGDGPLAEVGAELTLAIHDAGTTGLGNLIGVDS